MDVVIVVESLFGNTREVAEAIAQGLRERAGGAAVGVLPVADPAPPLDGVSLLVVGGPTHAFSMTRGSTREDAVRQGAGGDPTLGLREWIEAAATDLAALAGPAVTFDTRVRHVPGSAAAGAAKALRRAGAREVDRGESFWVTGTPGPLADGELDRARDWGRSLAERHLGHVAPAPH